MEALGGGFTDGPGQAGGVPVRRRGVCLGAFAQCMYFDGICIWACACLIPGVLYGRLQGAGGCTPDERVQP